MTSAHRYFRTKIPQLLLRRSTQLPCWSVIPTSNARYFMLEERLGSGVVVCNTKHEEKRTGMSRVSSTMFLRSVATSYRALCLCIMGQFTIMKTSIKTPWRFVQTVRPRCSAVAILAPAEITNEISRMKVKINKLINEGSGGVIEVTWTELESVD